MKGRGLVATTTPKLGLRENLPQFLILIVVNGFVGAMVGQERAILPALAETRYGLVATTAVLSFIAVFGFSKALTNYLAGSLSERKGRKFTLVLGWAAALPVPFLLMWAPTWEWVLVANLLLGVSQGLTWSMTVIMKIDLVGPYQRGLAMGLNEFAGYLALGGSALATGYIAQQFGLVPEPFYLGVAYAALGLLLSVLFVRDTGGHAALESTRHWNGDEPAPGNVFLHTTFRDRNLSSVVQAGFVNNLNDGMAWGLFPIIYASAGLSLSSVGWLAALYPTVWGVAQLYTGALSDRVGRKPLIVGGMIVQGIGIALVAALTGFAWYAAGGILLGLGTAMVYPTLLAAIGDVAHPGRRASTVGTYRLWRDAGYAFGAVVAGVLADAWGTATAVWIIAMLTILSGIVTLVRMEETLKRKKEKGGVSEACRKENASENTAASSPYPPGSLR